MQKFNKIKKTFMLVSLMMASVWCAANNLGVADGYSGITVKEAKVQGSPKGSSIHASINGHYLMVTFTENLGQVAVEVTTALGGAVECLSITTPNGLQIYIPNTGDYIVTFTLPNGDEYYGEFTVTD